MTCAPRAPSYCSGLPGNGIGLNVTVTLLTRHKHHCVPVKNPLTGRVDNFSCLTLCCREGSRRDFGALAARSPHPDRTAHSARRVRSAREVQAARAAGDKGTETRVSLRSRAVNPGFHSGSSPRPVRRLLVQHGRLIRRAIRSHVPRSGNYRGAFVLCGRFRVLGCPLSTMKPGSTTQMGREGGVG